MKKNLVIILIIVALLIGALAAYLTSNKSPESQPVANEEVVKSITVTTLEPDVFLKSNATSSEMKVEKSTTTVAGSVVKTGVQGRALLEIDQDETVLNFNTVTEIKVASTPSSNLSAGAIWSRVQKVVGEGEFKEIQTQNAVAVVRGTSFGMWYDSQTTRLWVTEGVVSLFAKDPVTGVVDQASEVKVSAGEKASRKGNEPIVYTKLNAQDVKDPWFVYNNLSYKLPAEPTTQAPSVSTGLPAKPKPTTIDTTYTLVVTSFEPNVVQEDIKTRVYIKGTALSHIDSLYLGQATFAFTSTSDTSGYITVAGLNPGTYDALIIDDKGRSIRMRQVLTVKAKPAPNTPPATYYPPTSPNTAQ